MFNPGVCSNMNVHSAERMGSATADHYKVPAFLRLNGIPAQKFIAWRIICQGDYFLPGNSCLSVVRGIIIVFKMKMKIA